jgi:RNA-directed DNA polymerase
MEPLKGTTMETLGSATVCTKLKRIAELAQRAPSMVLTTLAHHIDLDWMREAYRRTRKDAALGVDQQTAEQYAVNLEGNLRLLLERAKAGTYRAPPVRRVYLPKGNGETRPIGIPTFEDKILQRAVAMVLEAVYEQDFLDCSFGFRPRRSAHGALETLWDKAMTMRGGWIVEVDIRKFFDTMDHRHLMDVLRRRVRDGVLLRLISKWLHAGVQENGSISYPEAGSPQGGVISPILSNIYLHEVLDVWFEREVKPRLRGKAHMLRYADDVVMLFGVEEDARRVMAVLPKRFGKYGLSLHPEKTRLVTFRRPSNSPPKMGAVVTPPGTFDLLGFTHHWSKSHRGKWAIQRRTAKDRLSRALKRVAAWCMQHRHDKLSNQQRALAQKLRGHYAYYGITGNSDGLVRFYRGVIKTWRKWLDRRSQRARMTFERMGRLLERYPLPRSHVVHSLLHAANP